MFEYYQPSTTLRCYEYGSGNVELGISPSSKDIRVVYKFTGKNRSDLFYKLQANCKDVFEAYYPEGVVGWGNQMMRVKLDFMQYKHEEMLRYDAGSLLKIYEYIRKGEEEILKVLSQTGDFIPVKKVSGKNWVMTTKESIDEKQKQIEDGYKNEKLKRMALLNVVFPEANFVMQGHEVVANNFPIKEFSIYVNSNVMILFKNELRKIFKSRIVKELEQCFPQYRFYDNTTRISIYLEEKRELNGQEDAEYVKIIQKAVQLIKEKAAAYN